MKHYESDRSAGPRNKTFSAAAAKPKKALYAGHTALEQMHLGARFRTMNGMPLDANVPPLSMLQTTPDELSTPDSGQPRQAAGPAMQPAPGRHEAADRQRASSAGISGMPKTHTPEPLSAERESSSLHTMLIGSLITASVAIGLSSSLWLNSLDKSPRSQGGISLWEAPEPLSAGAAAASGPGAEDMKSGIKNAMSGIGQWLLTSFSLAPQAKQSLAADTRQDRPVPAAAPDNRSLPSPDGEAPVSLLPRDTAARADQHPAPLSDAVSAERPASVSPPLPGVAPSLQDASVPKKATSAGRTPAPAQTRTAARKKKTDEQQATASSSARNKYKSKSRAKDRPSSKSRHSSVAVARGERSDEIGRLKSQAFSETASDRIENKKAKRKPPLSDYIFLPQSSSKKESASTRNGKTVKVKQALAQCQHRSNFFRREYCKWQVCGGRWGKYGCPSFDNKTASY